MNRDVFNSLPKKLQDLFIEVGKEIEPQYIDACSSVRYTGVNTGGEWRGFSRKGHRSSGNEIVLKKI